jgi:YesN/AraC family two-component response regulator
MCLYCFPHYSSLGCLSKITQTEIVNSAVDNTEVNNSERTNTEGTNTEIAVEISTTKKYQRSALGTTQSDRVVVKINAVMEQDKLYLDADLSLQKLASYVAISPNYISQTLNETLSINFFDFVNQWRIEAAKPKIIANQDTVFAIALEVGFNARSSFYKAFKQETGKTPSEFRKTGT